MSQSCITITFGDIAENHVGMQKIGNLVPEGFTAEDITTAELFFKERGIAVEIHPLHHLVEYNIPQKEIEAWFLIARGGAAVLGTDADKLLSEQLRLVWDTKALMRGRVVNKHARHNLCYADIAQNANFEQGRGTVVAFDALPELQKVRNILPQIIGDKARGLVAEGNKYTNPAKCGIGFHGDAERNLVIAIRLGASMPMHYQWYYRYERVGARFMCTLNHGDVYVMSAKAVGNDWKRSSTITLRHAAGCSKYTE